MSIRIFVGVYCSQRMMMTFTRGAQGQICETTSRGPLGRQMLFAKSVYKLFGLLLVLCPSCYPLQQFTTTTIGPDHVQLTLLNWDTESVLALNKKLKVNRPKSSKHYS